MIVSESESKYCEAIVMPIDYKSGSTKSADYPNNSQSWYRRRVLSIAQNIKLTNCGQLRDRIPEPICDPIYSKRITKRKEELSATTLSMHREVTWANLNKHLYFNHCLQWSYDWDIPALLSYNDIQCSHFRQLFGAVLSLKSHLIQFKLIFIVKNDSNLLKTFESKKIDDKIVFGQR